MHQQSHAMLLNAAKYLRGTVYAASCCSSGHCALVCAPVKLLIPHQYCFCFSFLQLSTVAEGSSYSSAKYS
jgi:hypothetical protein